MAAGTVDGYTEDDLKVAAMTENSRNNSRKKSVCPHCQIIGHSTTRSRKCLYYNGLPTAIPTVARLPPVEEQFDPIANAPRNSLAHALQDTMRCDQYRLQDDPPSDVSFSAFQDADTWSDDEEEEEEQEPGVLLVGDL
jgi:hypothetical protein